MSLAKKKDIKFVQSQIDRNNVKRSVGAFTRRTTRGTLLVAKAKAVNGGSGADDMVWL